MASSENSIDSLCVINNQNFQYVFVLKVRIVTHHNAIDAGNLKVCIAVEKRIFLRQSAAF